MNFSAYEIIEMTINMADLIVAMVGLYLTIKARSDDDINNNR